VPNIVDSIKLPPFDLDAERSVLGIILLDNSKVHVVRENMNIDDFYEKNHRVVLQAIVDLLEENTPADLLTLKDKLLKMGKLEEIGGIPFVTKLLDDISSPANIEYYTQIIKDKSMLRRIIQLGNTMITKGYEAKDDAVLIIEDVENLLFSLLGNDSLGGVTHVKQNIKDAIGLIEKRCQDKGNITGIPTYFSELDKITDGLQKSDLIILACRPSVGKTSLSLNIMQHAAVRHNVPVLFFSLEMAKEQIILRLLSSMGKVNSQKLKKGNMRDTDWKKLLKCKKQLESAPIYIDDSHGMSISTLKAKCQRYKQEFGIGLIIIDYLQLIYADGRYDNRQYEITAITRSLKGLAKQLDIPIMVCSQLSRAVEKRGEKSRPLLSDLRDSGAIEQDADLVLMLHRPNMYSTVPEEDMDNFQDDGSVELIVSKNRNGPTGIINLVFLKEYTLFHDMSAEKVMDFGEEEISV
jgi:replicative DNA helicase